MHKNNKYILFGLIIVFFIFLFWNGFQKIQVESFGTNKKYDIQIIENVLTPEECDTIISIAKKKGLEESMVYTDNKKDIYALDKTSRNSKTAWIYDNENPIVKKIAKKAAELSGLNIDNQEPLQVAHYNKGGKFIEHHDACSEKNDQKCDKIDINPRRTTLLIYLNDDFEGGETEFTLLGKKIKPVKGNAIFFWDTYENKEIIQESMHRGNPVLNGEKWICTKWSR
jgi:prolyl 4-hydroxylase